MIQFFPHELSLKTQRQRKKALLNALELVLQRRQYSFEKIQSHQEKELISLVHFAYHHIPFYRKKYDQ
ncbi:MAG: hypothetical protein HYS98_04845, partial [Deltaproteobacteria bacterium]|nr:hypothetical protein [Deltaproteobacteria bacterium]